MPINLQERSAAFHRGIEDRDVTAAEHNLDDDYALVLVHPVPLVMPKATWIATLPDYIVHRYDVLYAITDVEGDWATILHHAN